MHGVFVLGVLFDDFNEYLIHAWNDFVERYDLNLFDKIPDKFARSAPFGVLDTQFIPVSVLLMAQDIVLECNIIAGAVKLAPIGDVVNI